MAPLESKLTLLRICRCGSRGEVLTLPDTRSKLAGVCGQVRHIPAAQLRDCHRAFGNFIGHEGAVLLLVRNDVNGVTRSQVGEFQGFSLSIKELSFVADIHDPADLGDLQKHQNVFVAINGRNDEEFIATLGC